MKKSKIVQLIGITIILLMFKVPSRVEGVEEPEVFATYSLEISTQPLEEDPTIPSEEIREFYYARYVVFIIVAADEEFQQISYWTPIYNNLGWKEAALNIVERSDNFIWEKYGVDFRIIGFTTWLSDNNIQSHEQRLYELADELNWNPSICGKTVLVGFTGQQMIDVANGRDVYGCAFNPRKNNTKVVLMRPQNYPFDDNVLHHEINHLFGAPECYGDSCVMSYKKTFITLWYEDGWVFLVGDNVYIAYQTHEYCYNCEWEVFNGQYSITPYRNPVYGKTSVGYGGKENGAFPK